MPSRKVNDEETLNAQGQQDDFDASKGAKDSSKRNPFFLSNPSNAIAIRIRELDECCCADVPCISIVKEYCESSSLHGLRYITEDGRHWTERVLWVLLCACGFFLTVYFIYPIWAKWNEKPTITTLDSVDHPVWEIDFPAVTLCPTSKVVEAKLNDLVDQEPWSSILRSRSDLDRLVSLLVGLKSFPAQVTGPEHDEDEEDLAAVIGGLGLANLTSLMATVMPACSDFILGCWWQGQVQDCSKIFQVRKTNDGFCCSFNALKQSETIDFSALKDILDVDDLDDIGIQQLDEGLHEFMPEHHDDGGGTGDADYFYEETAQADTQMGAVHLPLFVGKVSPDSSEGPDDVGGVSPRVKADPKKTRIRRLNSASYQRGLTVVLDSKPDEYFVAADNFIGFKGAPDVLRHQTRDDVRRLGFLRSTSTTLGTP